MGSTTQTPGRQCADKHLPAGAENPWATYKAPVAYTGWPVNNDNRLCRVCYESYAWWQLQVNRGIHSYPTILIMSTTDESAIVQQWRHLLIQTSSV